jgi:hypothetical protein
MRRRPEATLERARYAQATKSSRLLRRPLLHLSGYALVNLRQPPPHVGLVKFRSRALTAL